MVDLMFPVGYDLPMQHIKIILNKESKSIQSFKKLDKTCWYSIWKNRLFCKTDSFVLTHETKKVIFLSLSNPWEALCYCSYRIAFHALMFFDKCITFVVSLSVPNAPLWRGPSCHVADCVAQWHVRKKWFPRGSAYAAQWDQFGWE